MQDELDELKERFDSLVAEKDKYKYQIGNMSAQIKEDQKIMENMNNKLIDSSDLEVQIDVMKQTNERLRAELREKENEISLQRVEILNIQEAIEELQENTAVKHTAEVKKVDRASEKTFAEKFKELQAEYEFVKPQLQALEKYKAQVVELCSHNAELLK